MIRKILKNLKKRIVVTSLVMIALQPVLGVVILPQKTFANVGGTEVVISEVQIGQTGLADNEFIELYNPTVAAIDLSTLPLKLHIRNSSGTDTNKVLTIHNTIPSHGFFLVAPSNAYGTSIGADATYPTSGNMLVPNGGVYISNSETADTGVIDQVGWGTQPSGGYEGTVYSPTIPVDQSIERTGGVDTNVNSADFTSNTSPTPRNSKWPAPIISVNALKTNDTTPTITGTVNDVVAIIGVKIDGGTAAVGTNNVDGTWSYTVTTPLTEGIHEVAVTAKDAGNNVGTDTTTNELTIDLTAPTFTSVVTPKIAGPGVKTVDIEVTSNELLQEQPVTAVLSDRVKAPSTTYGIVLTITEIAGDPLTVYVPHVVGNDNKFTYTYTIEAIGKKIVPFTVGDGVDLSGNGASGTYSDSFEVDNAVILSPQTETPVATLATATVAETPTTVQNDQYGGSSDQGEEVKADTTVKPDEGNKTENTDQNEETKGKKNIPLWGIIFLLVLAGIGGYLFYSQSPDKSNRKK